MLCYACGVLLPKVVASFLILLKIEMERNRHAS